MNAQFEYFVDSQAEMFSFYRIPKLLFTDDKFKKLSSDAKILCQQYIKIRKMEEWVRLMYQEQKTKIQQKKI